MKRLTLGFLALCFVGCKAKIDSQLSVAQHQKFIVKTADGGRLILPTTLIQSKIIFDAKNPANSSLQLYLKRNGKSAYWDVPLKLPKLDSILGSNDAVRLDSKELGQQFGVMVMRQVLPGDDRFVITFHNTHFDEILGEMSFNYEPPKVLFDENKSEFLASYQKVKRKQRAAIVRIDAELDNDLSLPLLGWVPTVIDHIVNYSGAALVAPWIRARYSTVKWQIGSKKIKPPSKELSGKIKEINEKLNKARAERWKGESIYSREEIERRVVELADAYDKAVAETNIERESEKNKHLSDWEKVIKNRPVIDYFSFVHGGNQEIPLDKTASDLGLKKNQLRVVYTAACTSKHGTEWITDYEAVAAAGHKDTSASPLFEFFVLRNWSYGFNFEDTLVRAFDSGKRRVRAIEWLSFAKLWQEKTGVLMWNDVDDLLDQSEIQFSSTPEIPARALKISSSAILKGEYEERDLILMGVEEAKSLRK